LFVDVLQSSFEALLLLFSKVVEKYHHQPSSAKSCTARVRTDENGSMIVQQKNTHNHEANDRENERHALRVRAKRKADDDISQRPSKIIRGELQTMTEEHLQTSNLRCVLTLAVQLLAVHLHDISFDFNTLSPPPCI
jgi:hypothetical protein